jgi:hypothetical protein
MSNLEDPKLQHTDEQKPGSEQKSGNQLPQQKEENPSGQPKSPQSEQEKHDQEKKKHQA